MSQKKSEENINYQIQIKTTMSYYCKPSERPEQKNSNNSILVRI